MENIFIYIGNIEADIENIVSKQRNNFKLKYDSSNIISFNFDNEEDEDSISEKLKNTYENLSLFASKKLIIIKNISKILKAKKAEDEENAIENEEENDEEKINKNKSTQELLLNFFKKSNENFITIIQDKSIDKRSKFFKELQKLESEKKLKIEDISFNEKNNIEQWILKKIKENNYEITSGALRKILEKFNIKKNYKGEYDGIIDTIKIKNQLLKLFNYKKDNLIKEDDLNNFELNYENPNDNDIFELTNLIFEKDKKALKLFEKNFYNNVNEKLKLNELIFFNTIMINQIEELICVLDLIEKRKDDNEIATIMEWKNPKKIYPVKMKLKYFKKEELLKHYFKLEEIDKLSKTDQDISLYKLNLLIIEMINK